MEHIKTLNNRYPAKRAGGRVLSGYKRILERIAGR